MDIVSTNADNQRMTMESIYNDTMLGWLLKLYVMTCNSYPELSSLEVTAYLIKIYQMYYICLDDFTISKTYKKQKKGHSFPPKHGTTIIFGHLES